MTLLTVKSMTYITTAGEELHFVEVNKMQYNHALYQEQLFPEVSPLNGLQVTGLPRKM